jgi:poly(A) polymerase
MLRAVRLAARLGFTIEPQTANAIERLAPNLKAISPERIWQELEEILTASTRAAGWSLLVQLGLCDHLASGLLVRESLLAPTLRSDSAIQRRLSALSDEPIDPALALAALLCDDGVAAAKDVCRALRMSNRLTQAVVWLVRSLPMLRRESDLELADLKILMAEPNWPQLLELLRTDLAAADADQGPYLSVLQRAEAIDPADVAPPPLLSGDDLAALGLPPGPRFGEILKNVYRAQLNERITTHERARELAERLRKE